MAPAKELYVPGVKVIPISEAAPQLNQLMIDALKGETIVLTNGKDEVELMPRTEVGGMDYKLDELEAELLRALEGKLRPFSEQALDDACERAIGQRNQR